MSKSRTKVYSHVAWDMGPGSAHTTMVFSSWHGGAYRIIDTIRVPNAQDVMGDAECRAASSALVGAADTRQEEQATSTPGALEDVREKIDPITNLEDGP